MTCRSSGVKTLHNSFTDMTEPTEMNDGLGAVGRVEWIGIRPARRASMRIVDCAQLVPGAGIAGDHFRPKRSSLREVTVIQFEHLSQIAVALELAAIPPELLRRNLVIS